MSTFAVCQSLKTGKLYLYLIAVIDDRAVFRLYGPPEHSTGYERQDIEQSIEYGFYPGPNRLVGLNVTVQRMKRHFIPVKDLNNPPLSETLRAMIAKNSSALVE